MKRKRVVKMGIIGGIRNLFLTGVAVATIAYYGDSINAKPKINALLHREVEAVQLQKYVRNGKLSTYISYYDGKTKTEVPIARGELGVVIGDPAQVWQNLKEEQKQQYFLQEWQNLPRAKKEQFVAEAFEQLPLETRTQLLHKNWSSLSISAKYEIVKGELEQILNNYYRGGGK